MRACLYFDCQASKTFLLYDSLFLQIFTVFFFRTDDFGVCLAIFCFSETETIKNSL